jgi:hypothetical protein
MLFYLTIILFLFVGVFIFDINKQSENKSFFIFICFFLLVLMSSVRYRVGGDSLSYEEYYDQMPELNTYIEYLDFNPLAYQPIWLLLVAFCRTVSNEYYLFQIVHALIFNLSLYFFIQKYTPYIFSTLLLMFCSLMYFYYSFEIQRESLALAVFFFNIENLEKKRWFRYYILALISFLFHISAVFLFILPFMRKVELTKKMIFGLFFFAIVLFFLKGIIFSLITPFLILEAMKNKAEVYSEMTFSLTGFLAFFSVRVLLLMPFLLYRLSLKVKQFAWLDFSFLFLSILSQYFVGFERLLNYLFLIYFILFINFIYECKSSDLNPFLKQIVIGISILHIFFILDYKLFLRNPAGQHYYSLFYPYETIFIPIDNREREDYYFNIW